MVRLIKTDYIDSYINTTSLQNGNASIEITRNGNILTAELRFNINTQHETRKTCTYNVENDMFTSDYGQNIQLCPDLFKHLDNDEQEKVLQYLAYKYHSTSSWSTKDYDDEKLLGEYKKRYNNHYDELPLPMKYSYWKILKDEGVLPYTHEHFASVNNIRISEGPFEEVLQLLKDKWLTDLVDYQQTNIIHLTSIDYLTSPLKPAGDILFHGPVAHINDILDKTEEIEDAKD